MSTADVVTAAVMGDPLPGRLERAEALRLSLPEPRPEQDLAQWLPDSIPRKPVMDRAPSA